MRTRTEVAASGLESGRANRMLVDPRWLAAHLHDPRVRVIEVDVSSAAYDDWHIDGAALWNIYADVKDADYRTVGTAALEQLLARTGISPDSTVVFYGYAPALAVWLMKLHGHDDVRILDCSRDTWRAEGHPWSTAAFSQAAGSYPMGSEDRNIRADLAAVHAAIGGPGSTLVDVRSAAEYQGDCFWPSGGMEPGGRAGHVPTAVHQPIDGLYNADGSFRSASELRDIFAPLILGGDGELITYCTIGGRAATAWFVLTHLLGRDRVRVYDGSWAEWGRTAGTPVERVMSSDASSIPAEETMPFIQIVEVTTTRMNEIKELVQDWSATTDGRRTARRSTFTEDRDRPNTYVQMVEFPSYQEAMANSDLPETAEFAARLARLCDGPPVFRNLDVRRVDTFS